MPLVEAVTIELGSAIAKSILKTWLKDSSIGQDISSSLIDLLKIRTSDVLAQRRGLRQFEKIGEMVGEDLLPIFEREGARLDDSSRTAVALAVADAINQLSSDLLAKRNLDPTELEAYLLGTYPPTQQHFDSTESELYRRIIQLSCPYIVDIASQLPSFNERTFAEVLKREDILIEKADQILKEVRHLRERLDTTDASHFEEEYCKTVARKLDELELFGADVSSVSRRQRLSVAYIMLTVVQQTAEERKTVIRSERERGNQTNSDRVAKATDKEAERPTISVDKALARAPPLFSGNNR